MQRIAHAWPATAAAQSQTPLRQLSPASPATRNAAAASPHMTRQRRRECHRPAQFPTQSWASSRAAALNNRTRSRFTSCCARFMHEQGAERHAGLQVRSSGSRVRPPLLPAARFGGVNSQPAALVALRARSGLLRVAPRRLRQSFARAAAKTRPNHSLNRTRYGRPPWPGLRYAVHFLSPGQGVLPPRAG
jgi:hypothetical protein